jgi:hypothetical protein
MSAAIPPFPNTPSWRGNQLKHRDTFINYSLSEYDDGYDYDNKNKQTNERTNIEVTSN